MLSNDFQAHKHQKYKSSMYNRNVVYTDAYTIKWQLKTKNNCDSSKSHKRQLAMMIRFRVAYSFPYLHAQLSAEENEDQNCARHIFLWHIVWVDTVMVSMYNKIQVNNWSSSFNIRSVVKLHVTRHVSCQMETVSTESGLLYGYQQQVRHK